MGDGLSRPRLQNLVILDKPADLAVHPGAGREQGTLANRLLARYPDIAGVGGEGRPRIVYRLDLDTTGAIAVARTDDAYHKLTAAFAARAVDKTYLAVAYGTPREPADRIDLPIGRHRHHRKQMQIRSDGRPAVTHYITLESTTGISRLQLDLETGRTHQIRIYLKALGPLSLATRSTAKLAGAIYPAPSSLPCATSPAQRSTLGGWLSLIQSPARRSPSRPRYRRTCVGCGSRWQAASG